MHKEEIGGAIFTYKNMEELDKKTSKVFEETDREIRELATRLRAARKRKSDIGRFRGHLKPRLSLPNSSQEPAGAHS